MASVYKRGDRWYLRYKDEHGRWRDRVSRAQGKVEAQRLADDLERRAERVCLGVEPAPADASTETVGELVAWWLETYSAHTAYHSRTAPTVRLHLLSAPLARLRIGEVTSGVVEAYLQAKAGVLAPQSINHLQGFVSRAFNAAIKAGR